MDKSRDADPRSISLADWLSSHGTRPGTHTFNGVTYTDMNGVDWRIANNDWTTPRPD